MKAVMKKSAQSMRLGEVDRSTAGTDKLISHSASSVLRIYTDGGSRGNPGPAAFCVMFKNELDQVVYLHSEYLGVKTNNQAEMLAIGHAFEKAPAYTKGDVHLYSDSKCAISWLKGDYQVRHPNIVPLHEEIWANILKGGFRQVKFHHVRREHSQISICDRELNECLDSQLISY